MVLGSRGPQFGPPRADSRATSGAVEGYARYLVSVKSSRCFVGNDSAMNTPRNTPHRHPSPARSCWGKTPPVICRRYGRSRDRAWPRADAAQSGRCRPLPPGPHVRGSRSYPCSDQVPSTRPPTRRRCFTVTLTTTKGVSRHGLYQERSRETLTGLRTAGPR